MNFDRLKNYMDKITEEQGIPGVDIMVCKDHETLFRYYTGYSDLEDKKAMNGKELYFIYSMTKMLTCTCALQLFENGEFLMSDPVSKFLPEFEKMRITTDALNTANAANVASGKTMGESIENNVDGYAKNPITMKNLFTMTAGLDYAVGAQGIKDKIAEGKLSTREIVGAMSATVLGFEPGTRYRYSLCHDVIGAVIEVISGMSFGEYLKKNVLDPLGMKDTFFGKTKDEEKLSRMAALYKYNGTANPERIPLECGYCITEEYESGGAGLTSNTEDYALFLDALACGGVGKSGNRILSEATVKFMGENHLSGQALADFNNTRRGYGYGIGVRTLLNRAEGGTLSPVGEFGWDGAAGAFSMVDPVNKISLTYFQQVLGCSFAHHNKMRNILYSCLDK